MIQPTEISKKKILTIGMSNLNKCLMTNIF